MKKLALCLSIVCTLLLFAGCTPARTLHCDHCGKEVRVKESSNMEEDWIIYCKECNDSLFADDPLLGPG